jgi:hypothetical protein
VILWKKQLTDPKKYSTVTVIKSMDLVEAVREHLAKASPHVLRELVESFANALMFA